MHQSAFSFFNKIIVFLLSKKRDVYQIFVVLLLLK